jgi:hypothetical protein
VNEHVWFFDANVLASPVTRTLLLRGAETDGVVLVWSAHAEAEADRNSRPGATASSVVRTQLLGRQLSASGRPISGLRTRSDGDRQIIADAIAATERLIVTVDADDFALEDLREYRMSAVNPDYLMALRFSPAAYRAGVHQLADGTTNPPRAAADVHLMLGRRHPHRAQRFGAAFDSISVAADPDQPSVIFQGATCVHCDRDLRSVEELQIGLCTEHMS